ncbi:hypothetical protein [Singulisphaera sp. PoT]|uniref:hypothetical protein n=1 Tax=Singulisphaera sp. PoT TaxID=3411797 RepID=UPI003BF5C161
MSVGPEQQRLTPAERANLVAYLDGELNEAESRAISTKLTKSPTARREVEVLEKTWEMLELLERPKASEDFTARTLHEVEQLDLKGNKFESALMHAGRRTVVAALWMVASMVALGGGYAIMQWVLPNPTARLARDLSIAEYLDEYRDAGSFQFLQELESSQEFNADRD